MSATTAENHCEPDVGWLSGCDALAQSSVHVGIAMPTIDIRSPPSGVWCVVSGAWPVLVWMDKQNGRRTINDRIQMVSATLHSRQVIGSEIHYRARSGGQASLGDASVIDQQVAPDGARPPPSR